MAFELFQNKLRDESRLRSIIVGADGFEREPLASAGLALQVQLDPALRIPADCRGFEATTLPIPMPLQASECVALIDPARWQEFSDIRVPRVTKQQDRGPAGWTGSIEEVVVLRWNGKDFRYVNELAIDFRIEGDGSIVEFELTKALEGGLAFEVGYLRLDPGPLGFGMVLTSHKELRYAPGSEWCEWPLPALEVILGTWLNAAAAQYALGMVAANQ